MVYNGKQGIYSRILNENTYSYDQAGNRLTNAVNIQGLNAIGTPTVDGNNNPVLTTRNEKYETPGGASGYDARNRLTNVDYGDGQTQV